MRSNNKSALNTDNQIVKQVLNDFNDHLLDLISIYAPSLKDNINSEGFFDIKDEPTGFIRTLKLFKNIAATAKKFIFLYDEYIQQKKSKLTKVSFVTNCLPLMHTMRGYIKKIYTGNQFIPLPPITSEGDYLIGFGLIHAFQTFLNNPTAFNFLLTEVKDTPFEPIIEESHENLIHFQASIKDQIGSSQYAIGIIKETENYLKKMQDVFSTYQSCMVSKPIDVATAKEQLHKIQATRSKLFELSKEYNHLPDHLPYGPAGSESIPLKSKLLEQQLAYIKKLEEDQQNKEHNLSELEEAYINFIKNKYASLLEGYIKDFNAILLPSHEELQEANSLFEQLKTENLSPEHQEIKVLVAKEKYETFIGKLHTALNSLKNKQDEARSECDLDSFLSIESDEGLRAKLYQSLLPLQQKAMNHFSTYIRSINEKIEVADCQKTALDQFIIDLNTQQLFKNILGAVYTATQIQAEILITNTKITAKQTEVSNFQRQLKRLKKAEKKFSDDITQLEKTVIPQLTISVGKLNRAIPNTERDLAIVESKRSNDEKFVLEADAANNELKNLKDKWFKTATIRKKIDSLEEQTRELGNMLLEKQAVLDGIALRLRNERELLARDTQDLVNSQQDLSRLKLALPKATKKRQEVSENLGVATNQLNNLTSHLFRLRTTLKLLELKDKLLLAEQYVKEVDNQKTQLIEQLTNEPSSLIIIVKLYNTSNDLNAKTHFNDISVLLEEISSMIASLSEEDPFKQVAANLLSTRSNELYKYREDLAKISSAMRCAADTAAAKISSQIRSGLENLLQLFKQKTSPVINHLKEFHKRRKNYGWYTAKSLEITFEKILSTVNNSSIQVADFHSYVFTKQQMTKDIFDPTILKPHLDFESLLSSICDLQVEHQKACQELKNSNELAKQNLLKQARRTAIKQQYVATLDQYEAYRNKKYRFKDFFYKKDKIARHEFIAALKKELWHYESLDHDKDALSQLLTQGYMRFTTGRLSNKKNPAKNLNDIISLLIRDINNDSDFNSEPISCLRLSGFTKNANLEKDHRKNIHDQYRQILDTYELLRNKKYKPKDLFHSKDKVLRHEYLIKLKSELLKYESSPANQAALVKTIKEGLTKFSAGNLSNKNDPTKNLQGILDLLLQDIVNPLATHTSLRISGYLDREHAPVPLDKLPQLRAVLQQG